MTVMRIGFVDHPRSVGQTYKAHMASAAAFGAALMAARAQRGLVARRNRRVVAIARADCAATGDG